MVDYPIASHSYITVYQRKPSTNLMATAVKVMVEQSTFCDIVCKSPETQQMAKIFAEDGWVSSMSQYIQDFSTSATKMLMCLGIYRQKSSLNWWIFMGTSLFLLTERTTWPT